MSAANLSGSDAYPSARVVRRAVRPLCIALLGLAFLWLALSSGRAEAANRHGTVGHTESREATTFNAPTALSGEITAVDACEGVSAIPTAECEALAALFAATDGPNWSANTNWGSGSPCTWYGVGCTGGHVYTLDLPANGLSGTLPTRIGALEQLTRLSLESNRLRGSVPTGICALVDTVADASLAYNRLDAPNRRVKNCLDLLDPDWSDTQTVAPRNVQVTQITTDSVQLSWRPISYTGDGGYYEIAYATSPDGPFTRHGATTDKSAGDYLVDGLTPGTTYFLRIRTYTPGHTDQASDLYSDAAGLLATTRAVDDPLLVLIYFPADNDLSPYVNIILQRIRRGTEINPNLHVYMLADRRGEGNTHLFSLSQGVVTQTNVIKEAWGVNELNTTDPDVLSWFLNYGRAQYPDARTMVSLMGHGIGMMPEFGWIVGRTPDDDPVVQQGIPPLPRGIEATPGDVADQGGYMSTIDFGNALAAATDDGADPFDMLFFDQCFQGNFDVLYEVRNYADIFVASPNYAWLAAPYHQYMAVFAPSATPAEMAQAIIRLYQGALTEAHPNAIFWLHSADIEPIATAVNSLAAALRQALAAGEENRIAQAAQEARYVDTTQCGFAQFELAPPDELLGAESFARRLGNSFGPGDAYGVSGAAQSLITAMDNVTTLARTGSPYIAPDATWDYRDSLTLLAPLARNSPANVAWRASIYTAVTNEVTAVWSPAPEQTVQITTTLAAVRDGSWHEFIADWYTTPLTPTIGEWCQYSPPALVTGEVTETLALAMDPTPDGLALSWTPTTDEDAAHYWILARRSSDVNRVVLDVVGLDQTAYIADLPKPGTEAIFTVVAQDELGVTLAASNDAAYTTPPAVPVYLPLLQAEP